jgi:peroxiredoxin
VVVFWAGWWPRSAALAAPLRDLVQRYNGKPFAVLGINADGSREVAARVAEQERMSWPSIFDGNTGRGPIATKWGIVIWPTVYVIDQNGIIRHVGYDASKLEPVIDGLLATKK